MNKSRPGSRGRGTVRVSGDSVAVRRPQDLLGRCTLKVQRDGRNFTVDVAADGEGLISHAGAALLGEVADRVGLTRGFSNALVGVRDRRGRHDPGRVIRDLAVMLADGGDCLSDLRAVRDQAPLFVSVRSPVQIRAPRYREPLLTRVLRASGVTLLGRGGRGFDRCAQCVPSRGLTRALERLPLLIAAAHHPERERRVGVSELLHQVGRVLADRDQDRGERLRSF
jgi:Transposase DDE domain group 1